MLVSPQVESHRLTNLRYKADASCDRYPAAFVQIGEGYPSQSAGLRRWNRRTPVQRHEYIGIAEKQHRSIIRPNRELVLTRTRNLQKAGVSDRDQFIAGSSAEVEIGDDDSL